MLLPVRTPNCNTVVSAALAISWTMVLDDVCDSSSFPTPVLFCSTSSSSKSRPNISYCWRNFEFDNTVCARFSVRNVSTSPPGLSGWCFVEGNKTKDGNVTLGTKNESTEEQTTTTTTTIRTHAKYANRVGFSITAARYFPYPDRKLAVISFHEILVYFVLLGFRNIQVGVISIWCEHHHHGLGWRIVTHFCYVLYDQKFGCKESVE